MKKERIFKVLGKNRMPCHGGSDQWPKPKTWREQSGPLKLCENGLHLCRMGELPQWINEEIWEAEYSGEKIAGDDKIVVAKARLIKKVKTWNKKTRLLFAADCADHVLKNFEDKYPEDKRPRLAIKAVRDYARGKITQKELKDAHSAAYSAAYSSASASAAAAHSAYADRKEEIKWQAKRLMAHLYPKKEKKNASRNA